jgi:hypothetical protein
MKRISGNEHFSLDKTPLICYEKIAKGQWHASKTAKDLWAAVFDARGSVDPRGRRQLCWNQPLRIGAHDLRTAQLEKTHWPAEVDRRPSAAGAVGKSRDFGASGQKDVAHGPIRKEHFASGASSGLLRTYRHCGAVHPDRCGIGAKPGAAAAFPGVGQPVSLSGIRHAFWGKAPISVLCEPARQTGGRLLAVFLSGLADEASGSMDRLGRRNAWALASARGQQQPVFGTGQDPQSFQHAARLCLETPARRLAKDLWGGPLPGGDAGGQPAVLRRLLPGGQLYRAWPNQRPGPHGSQPSAPWGAGKNRDGLSAGQKCAASAHKGIKDDEGIGCFVVSGAAL